MGTEIIPYLPPDIRYAENNEKRLPMTLILDCSGSMSGSPINELNNGLRLFESELKSDVTARNCVEILTIRCADSAPTVVTEWRDAADFSAPTLTASGATPLGQSLRLALDRLEQERRDLANDGIPQNKPWVMLISDGGPTDGRTWTDAAQACRALAASNRLMVFPVAVQGADLRTLSECSPEGAFELDGLKFGELFRFVSDSVRAASRKPAGEDPTQGEILSQLGASGWNVRT